MKKAKEKKQKDEQPRRGFTVYAFVFGLFLGLALLKFGNPIILDSKVSAPASLGEALSVSWPPRWSAWFLAPLAIVGFWIAFANKLRWRGSKWLWILPLIWFVWQLISATQSVDDALTRLTVLHFAGCVTCWFLGAWLLREPRALRVMLIGLIAAFAFCLVRAVDQKLIEFPREREAFLEGERTGWTNYAPGLVLQMKADGFIITTNGEDVVNPIIKKKYGEAPPAESSKLRRLFWVLFVTPPRAFGTLVYPNALAAAIILLLPATIALAVYGTQRFRRVTRFAAIGLTLFLGFGSLFWTGSKSGWLIALAMLGVLLLRFKWPTRLKWLTVSLIFAIGVIGFAVRFQSYFSAGATSLGARFDYWRAAIENTVTHSGLGSGPGTFFRVYEQLKRPESEMTRLVHNDYLQQFSDSGVPGGLVYLIWICLASVSLAKRFWRVTDPLCFALFLGLLGWFIQGLSEFSFYIPALAWTAFAIAGSLLGWTGMDSTSRTPVNKISRR